MTLNVVILAAGKGTRMKSGQPKVLHLLSGKPLLQHVIEVAQSISPQRIFIVYGHEGENIKKAFSAFSVQWVSQEKQNGTAHAVMQVLPHLNNPEEKVLILYGDMPLISSETLKQFIESLGNAELGLLTTFVKNPQGFGRILRNKKQAVIKIVEEKELTSAQKKIKEINAGVYLTKIKYLKQWLTEISPHNAQKEYYLTDIVQENIRISDMVVENAYEVYGVNDLQQLYKLECYHQKQLAKQLRLSGVAVGKNVFFEGNIDIAPGSSIGAGCILKNVKIARNVQIRPYCIIEGSVIEEGCVIGPFARLRPETHLHENVHIGNFVEVKKSHIGMDSKIPHLSYVGDTIMGEKVNFGAGAIVCNYDGANKHQTIIENNVFIGSDTQLVAPITIEEGAYIGTGSTITKSAPANKLTLGRARQKTIERWTRPKKQEK
jgi:bifunctional UDP-N-acetylglucosamine pyrophosphorylase/glucosamine-1-phosphate N-acetyltransferase